ncbi:hypothetical protein EDC96DRAFT_546617 [Choanephora cucurbitarum]|nr:hypothetical protein EDC96DRAFT_546617 [Choanephora cucurbitarum]
MSQLKRVETYAKKLHEACKPPVQSDEILQLIHDISLELLSYMTEDNLDTTCSLLFSKEGAITYFLFKFRESATGEIATAISEILKTLCTFLKKRKSNSILQKHARLILSQCAFIGQRGSANNKSMAIEVMMVMMDPKNKFDTTDFDLSTIYEVFSSHYITEKKSTTVKAKILELLGMMAQYHTQIVSEAKRSTLKRWCFDSVLHQVSNQAKTEGEGNIISGSLTCLNSLLHRFSFESEEIAQLLQVIIKVLYAFRETSRFAAPLSALILFRENASLFSHLVLPHCERLYGSLQFWATHHNVACYKFGVASYEEFLRQLSVALYDNVDGARETAIFTVFMQKFKKTLEDADSLENINQVSAAIRSIGYFSKIFSKKLSSKEIDGLRNSLVRISDWFYSEANANQKQYLRHLPAFIRSYTLFAEEFESIPVELMDTIHQMCDIFVKNYHDISGFYRRSGCLYIRELLRMLYKKSEGTFRSFVNTLFEKTLVCTCTTARSPEEEDHPLYTELLYFWKILLKTYKSQAPKTEQHEKEEADDEEDVAIENVRYFYQDAHVVDPEGLTEALYDAFISNSLKLIKTFNMKLKNMGEGNEEHGVTIVSSSLVPVNRKDFLLFQNFVKFWSAIFQEIDHARLAHWVHVASSAIIDLSVLHPLVSGFYRMQADILIACEKLHFFQGCHVFLYHERNGSTHQLDKPKEYVTYLIVREYLREVWHRLQQFTDELLASCLHLLLSYPVEFFDVNELITPLEKALRLGISYHPLAAVAMDSLDKLLDPDLNFNIDSKFLSHILPCINEYLLVGVVSSTIEQESTKKNLRIPTAQQRRYEVANTRKTSGQLGVVKRNYSDLPALQRRMMQFLGKLGGKNKQLLLRDEVTAQKTDILAWDSERRVELRVPFKNIKVTIYLDEYLPRICELAESSPDRQVKIAACELLHGLLLYMIGSSAFRPTSQSGPKTSEFYKFYLHIFPIMLRLAIDPDQITRDMFQALYAQVIHWLTNNAQSENTETVTLLQALLEASCSTDAGLRDYGAECIQEFVKWSIKQTSRSSEGADNIRSLLRRLYNLMASPSVSKRFGAALVFNRIYRLFREEEKLVKIFTIEILGQLFLSLKIAENDHPSVGTRDQIVEAISHIRRILREKAPIFCTTDTRNAFISNQNVKDLPTLVHWTFEQSGKLQRTYAKVCINFFAEFCVFLNERMTPKQWLHHQLKNDPLFLVRVFENNQLKTPSVTDDENHVLTGYLHWIKHVNSALDGYIWLIERDIIDPLTLLEMTSSAILEAISFLVRNKPSDYLEEKLQESIVEKHKIISIYAYLSVRLIYFFDLILKSKQQGDRCFQYLERVFSNVLYHSHFIDSVASTLLLPKEISETIQSYQGNAITHSSVARMFDIAKGYILTMKEKGFMKFVDELATSISRLLQSEEIDIALNAKLNIDRSSMIQIIQTVEGIRFLQSIDMLEAVCQKGHQLNYSYPSTTHNYYNLLLNTYLALCPGAQKPLQLQLTGSLLLIVFSQAGFAKRYATQLLGLSGPLETFDPHQKVEIFQRHIVYVSDCIANNFDVFSEVFSRSVNSALIHEYLFLFFEFLKNNRLSHRKLVWSVTNHLVEHTALIEAITQNWNNDEQLFDLVAFLKLLFGADPGILSRSKRKPIFDLLWQTFMRLLEKENAFKVKSAALDLLPIFICLDEDHTEKLSNVLYNTFIKDAPNPTSLLKKGSVMYNEYVGVLDKLLDTMATFKSVMIFKLLKVTFVQEEKHIHEAAINKSIERFSRNLGLNSFLSISQDCFDLFKDDNYLLMHRRNLIELIIFLFANAEDNHIVAFFEKNISYILGFAVAAEDKTKFVINKPLDWGLRACCLRLIQVMYERLPKEHVDKDSRINQAWLKSPENTRKKIMHASVLGVFTYMRNSTSYEKPKDGRAEYFSYTQATVNAMIAALLRMSDKPGLYEQFFCKGTYSYIWDDIIDSTHKLHLVLELDQPMPKQRVKDLAIRAGHSTHDDETSKYMSSIDLKGSSLTFNSLSQATFSETILQENQTEAENADQKDNEDATNPIDEDVTMEDGWDESKASQQNDTDEELEIDNLNEHPIMLPITNAIRKLHNDILPPNESTHTMPKWMADLNNAFTSAEDIKIQVYIARLIANYPFAFEHYAQHWVLPLMNFVTQGSEFGTPINYLTQDICIILIVWGRQTEIPHPSTTHSKRILFQFMEYLIAHVYHNSPRITRSNIQIIRGIFQNWGKFCPVPSRAIYEHFNHPQGEEFKNVVGLQVAGIVYSNGVNIYAPSEFSFLHDLPELVFLSAMARNILYKGRKSADIPANAAELMSWSLKFLKQQKSPIENQVRDLYKRLLTTMGSSRDHSDKQFLKCMNRIYLHDGELGEELFSSVTFRLGRLSADDKMLALNFIDACWSKEKDEDIFNCLHNANIPKMLFSQDIKHQTVILKVLNTVFDVIQDDSIEQITLDIIKIFSGHSNTECRSLYFRFLRKAFKNDHLIGIRTLIKAEVLKGLVDKDEAISLEMLEFVKTTWKITDDICSTISTITSDLYMDETQDTYLLYATHVILENTKGTYDINEPIFDKPLPEARFDAGYQKINTNWKQSTSYMTPLFSESQQSTLGMEDLKLELRRTQSLLEFSVTQGTGRSLVATFNPTDDDRILFDKIDEVHDMEDDDSYTKKTDQRPNPYYNKRFLTETKSVVSRFHADRNEQLQKKYHNLLNSMKEAGEKKVTLSRAYRLGELPDIQIPRRDLISPLEVLARADFNISRLLYSSLVVSVVNETKQTSKGDEFQATIVDMINSHLRKSTANFTPTIGSFLRIVFDLGASIDGLVIKDVSSKSYNHHIGIAILERQLLNGTDAPKPKKRAFNSLPPTKEKWIYLSLLYQDIDELEIFQNSYLANVVSNEYAKAGVKAQNKGDFASSFNYFDRALVEEGKNANVTEKSLWEQQMLYCRTQLGQWDLIARDTLSMTENSLQKLWTDCQDPYLSYFMRSFSKLKKNAITTDPNNMVSEWTTNNPNPIFRFLDLAYENDMHRREILHRFAYETSLVETYRHNYSRARQVIGQFYDSILSSWTTLHPLAHTSRLSKLSQLQRAVELEDYLNLHKSFEDGTIQVQQVEKFVKQLMSRYPNERMDRMDVWHDILLSRFEFVEQLEQSDPKIAQQINTLLDQAQTQFLKVTGQAAIEQHNTTYFTVILDKLKSLNKVIESQMGFIAYTEHESIHKPIDNKQGFIASTIVKSLLFAPPPEWSPIEHFQWKILLSRSFNTVKNQIIAEPMLFDATLNTGKQILRKYARKYDFGHNIESADAFVNYLEKTGYEVLVEAGQLISEKENLRATYIWQLGRYCDESLHVSQNAKSTLQPDFNSIEYSQIVIQYYFEAINRDRKEAIEFFPRLLELIEIYPENGSLFRQCSMKVDACWKFIRWIPQLVSSIATPIAPYIFPILERIAESYPKALYYPFQMSCEFYDIKKNDLSEESQRSVERILYLIRSPIMEQFSYELKRLSDPDHIAKDFIEYIRSIMLDKEVPKSFIESRFEEFYNLLLNNYSENMGSIPKKIAAQHGSHFLRVFGENGKNIPALTSKKLDELNAFIKSKFEPKKEEQKSRRGEDKTHISSYSKWLYSFKNTEHDEEIEIPGQYDGYSKPFPESHAKIASVSSKLLILESLRKPKRITFYGTDEKEYKFLVKGGEDLRLDERIEQLFTIMNDMIKNNAFCSKQNIKIHTYKVIPMASNLGIIEWVNDTIPLQQCITSERSDQITVKRAISRYNSWIEGHTSKSSKESYGKYYAAFADSRETVVKSFAVCCDLVPNTVLRNFVFKLAASPEAFLFLRKDFAYSLACISIFGYILGIGDRHLQNFLLDTKSGRLVPIDFGYAFGAATELLPIPELVPFRLTRQLIGVLEPLGVSGILEDVMTNILSAIQEQKESLLNIMKVFVKEPLLEWQKNAARIAYSQKKSRQQDMAETLEHVIQWYPQNKIEIARRKLDKENPANTLITELTNGHANKYFYKDVVAVAKGIPSIDIRADIDGICADTNEQVKCLINLATDSRALGVAWAGWQSYL